MESLSQTYSGLDPVSAIKAIIEQNTKLIEKRLEAINAEAEFVEQVAQDVESGGFWQEFIADPLSEVAEEFTELFSDPKSVSEAKASFESLTHSLFDPASTLAQTTAGILGPRIASVGRVAQAPTQTPSVLERVLNLGGAKSPLAAEPCQRNVIKSVATTAASVVAGSLNNVARAIKTAHSAVSYLTSTVEDIGPALANLAIQNLDSLLIDQDALLDQIDDLVKDILDIIEDMNDEDYLTDHVRLIRQEQLDLASANNDLELAKRQLLLGGPLNEPRWDTAKSKISDSAKALCDSDFGNPTKQILLYGHVAYLDYLLDILARQQDLTSGIADNVARFRTNFVSVTAFDSLFAPVIDQIQCRVRKIIEDMDATLSKNQFIRYIVKEKQWCLELLAIEAFMKFADKMDIESNLRKFTGQAVIDDAMEEIEQFLGSAERTVDGVEVGQVIATARSFSESVKRKAARNIPKAGIITQGQVLRAQIEIAKANNLGIQSLTGSFTTKVITTAGAAVSAVNTLMSYSSDRGISAFVSALSEGDIVQALQLDTLTSSVESQLSNLTAQFTQAVGDTVAFSDLLTMTEAYQEEARSINLLDDLKTEFAENHLRDLSVNETKKYSDLATVVDRVASKVGVATASTTTMFIPASRQA